MQILPTRSSAHSKSGSGIEAPSSFGHSTKLALQNITSSETRQVGESEVSDIHTCVPGSYYDTTDQRSCLQLQLAALTASRVMDSTTAMRTAWTTSTQAMMTTMRTLSCLQKHS